MCVVSAWSPIVVGSTERDVIMDIYGDTDDPTTTLKPGKMRTIHLHRRPGIPYFGFGVSCDTIHDLKSLRNSRRVYNAMLQIVIDRYAEDASTDWDSLLPKLFPEARANFKDYRYVYNLSATNVGTASINIFICLRLETR